MEDHTTPSIDVIQVGIGGMGNAWLKAIEASPNVGIAALVEIDDSVAEAQCEQYGLDRTRVFRSLDAALAATKADGVINVTPPQFHEAVSIMALAAGVPVLSEKPLADTLEAAQAIVRKANETDVLHMVAQNRRYSIPALTLKQVIDSGYLGAVGSVSVEFYRGPHFGGFREVMPYPLVVDMAIHHFDMMRYFLGRNATSIHGQSWNPPWSWYDGDASTALLLEFQDSLPVTYQGSWCSTAAETSWNGHWRFECENGVIVMRDDQVYVYYSLGDWPEPEAVSRSGSNDAYLVTPVQAKLTDQAYLLNEFYEAITTGRTPETTAQDNIHSLAIVFAALRSFATNGVVEIDALLQPPA